MGAFFSKLRIEYSKLKNNYSKCLLFAFLIYTINAYYRRVRLQPLSKSAQQKSIDVSDNAQSKRLTLPDKPIKNIDDDEDASWKNVLNAINNESNSNQLIICNELLNEMKSRENDMKSLKIHISININVLELVKKRHDIEINKLTQILHTDEYDNELSRHIRRNNEKWQHKLKTLINENEQDVIENKQKQYFIDYSEELNGQIENLLTLISVFNVTNINCNSSFVVSIKDLHQYNHEKKNIDSIYTHDQIVINDNCDDIKENYKQNIECKMQNLWLNKDENRNDVVDKLIIDEQQFLELYESVTYLDRLLYSTDNDFDEITNLYFPICNKLKKHNIILPIFDGVMLCKLINKISRDYIDERVVCIPNTSAPFPINDIEIRDNMQLVICSAQSMGIHLLSYDLNDWLQPNNWVTYSIHLIKSLSTKYLNKRITIHKHNQLIRLLSPTELIEDPDKIRKLSAQQWLQRWINYLNSKPVLQEISDDNYINELFIALKLNNKIICDIEKFSLNPEIAADSIIKKYGNITNIKSIDLCSGCIRLQYLFAADLFENESGLNELSDEEKYKYKSFWKRRKKKEESVITWINNVLSPDRIIINNLANDLCSGYILLKLLDKSKPGCVKWRNVRKHKKCRHKFDKLNNCNMFMKLCKEFNFSMVGMAGSDIVDANEKLIHSLLLQLMRFYSMKQLSLLLFKNAIVTDNDILKWVNVKINECDCVKSKPITSFKDKILSTCIFYIELLKTVKPNSVDLTLCNYDVKPLKNLKIKDKQKIKRIQNAIMTITLIRKFGGELFVGPNHLCCMENKAILSVFAAIMTISSR
eukprot:188962_1